MTDIPASILAEARRIAIANYGQAMRDYIPPCPWNPFPLDSAWGREIEDRYRRDQMAHRRVRAILVLANVESGK